MDKFIAVLDSMAQQSVEISFTYYAVLLLLAMVGSWVIAYRASRVLSRALFELLRKIFIFVFGLNVKISREGGPKTTVRLRGFEAWQFESDVDELVKSHKKDSAEKTSDS